MGLSVVGALAGCDTGRRVLPPLGQPSAAPVEVSSAAPSPVQDGLLPATAVGRVPLGIDDVNRLAGKGLFKTGDRPLTAPMEVKGTVKPPECQIALHALQNKAVAGAAFNAFQFVVFPASDGSNGVFEEAVVTYPELASASSVFHKLADAVGPCGGKTVDEQQEGSSQSVSYEIAVEDTDEGVLRWTEHEKGAAKDDVCVFESRIVKNLVFEVVECGPGAGDLATKAADALASRAV
ncbi:MAG: sensor domain-containing protein [Segniliparus sp.]|uniref:sensor domain-containing protein n=1 Tax=Segniliparus sp. TaxID=2804064 RepID=UPI003F3CC18A